MLVQVAKSLFTVCQCVQRFLKGLTLNNAETFGLASIC